MSPYSGPLAAVHMLNDSPITFAPHYDPSEPWELVTWFGEVLNFPTRAAAVAERETTIRVELVVSR